MDLLIVGTSSYDDPFAEEWKPDLRHTVSFLRRRGVDTGYTYVAACDETAELFSLLDSARPRALFLEISEENREPALHLATACGRRHPGILIFVGGIPPTLAPDSVFESCAQVTHIVGGEREAILLEAIERIREQRPLDGVLGLQSRFFRNPPRPLLPDLDVLGSIVYDGLPEMLGKHGPADRTAFLRSSRGCYGRCSFCGIPGFYRTSPGAAWRGRSAKAVVAEMEGLVESFQVRRFVFEDDDFIGPGAAGRDRALGIAGEIDTRKLNVEYSICCRLNDLNAGAMSALKASGLSVVGLSVESANQESLNLLRKGLRADAIYPALHMLEGLGIRCEVNMIFFDPLLTLEGVRKNLKLLDYLRRSEHLSYSDAFPFTELHAFRWSPVSDTLRAAGLLDEDGPACRFADPRVAELAAFVRRLHARIPIVFKKRLLFEGASLGLRDSPAARAILHIAPGVRHWLGLSVMPRFIVEACDLLTDKSPGSRDGIANLEERFDREMEILRALERRVSLR
jgi:anaerobic magnesium-protoporphyrin IX monomethyl ester cyclase